MKAIALLAALLAIATFGNAAAQPPVNNQAPAAAAPAMELMQMDLAATKVVEMARFYEAVFQTPFKPIDAGDVKLYSGKILGMVLLIAPNSVAGVVAEQSRHQFEVTTPDIVGVIQRIKAAGGTVRDDSGAAASPRYITALDPDGNTIVFIEKK